MSDQKTAYEQLSAKRRSFVDHFIACGMNKTKAARLAGYTHPDRQGWRLCNEEAIQNAISEQTADVAMSKEEVLIRLGRIARLDYDDFLTMFNEEGNEIEPYVDLHKAWRDGSLDLIKEYRREVTTITGDDFVKETITHKLKLHDAHAALKDLARYHGMNKDTLEITDKTDPEEVRREVMDQINAIRSKIGGNASE